MSTSTCAGLAGSMTMLVAARALQGIGGGAIMVTAMAVIGEVIPLRERGRYQGALGAVFGVTTVIGPISVCHGLIRPCGLPREQTADAGT